MIPRQTIAREVSLSGVGLHTGCSVTLRFKPREARGVVFVRTDLGDVSPIRVTTENMTAPGRRTSIGDPATGVTTIEHVMAAVTALGIDDLEVELNAPEPPAMDGSAEPFMIALEGAGLVERQTPTTVFRVERLFEIQVGESKYCVRPFDGLKLNAEIEWDHPLIRRQRFSLVVTRDTFSRELSRARTFGFLSEEKALRELGLIKGASAENVVALDATSVVGTTLRWPDEFVRHKILDLLGDIGLLGGRLQGEIDAFRPSHGGNVAVTERIKQEATSSSVLGIDDIMNVLPHRYPMLLVDRIVEFEEGKRIVGIKNVTINEPFFQGHFPGHPIMPGVLIVEAMAQAGGMLMMNSVKNPQDKVVYFMSLDRVKFRKPVVPGDQLRFELELVKFRGKTCQMKGVSFVDGTRVAEAEMMAAIMDR